MTERIVHYNATTPAGRAITHLLSKSALANVHEGLELEEALHGGGRTLSIHPAFSAWASKGECALLLVVESLASSQKVCLSWILGDVDQASARAIGEAVLIASGFTGHTMVGVPA